MEENALQLYRDGLREIDFGNRENGRALLKQSADAGCKAAMYKYAYTCTDEQQKIELYKIASDKGCGKAAFMLGYHYALDYETNRHGYIAGEYFLKAYSCGIMPEHKYFGDDRDSFMEAADLKDIIKLYVENLDVSFEDPYAIIPIARDAYRFGVISNSQLQKVEELAEINAGIKLRQRIARTCPKCGAYYAKVEKRKQSMSKRAAVGGAIGLIGGLPGILLGAGIGALTGKEKECCVCQGCGYVWEYKLPQ